METRTKSSKKNAKNLHNYVITFFIMQRQKKLLLTLYYASSASSEEKETTYLKKKQIILPERAVSSVHFQKTSQILSIFCKKAKTKTVFSTNILNSSKVIW